MGRGVEGQSEGGIGTRSRLFSSQVVTALSQSKIATLQCGTTKGFASQWDFF